MSKKELLEVITSIIDSGPYCFHNINIANITPHNSYSYTFTFFKNKKEFLWLDNAYSEGPVTKSRVFLTDICIMDKELNFVVARLGAPRNKRWEWNLELAMLVGVGSVPKSIAKTWEPFGGKRSFYLWPRKNNVSIRCQMDNISEKYIDKRFKGCLGEPQILLPIKKIKDW